MLWQGFDYDFNAIEDESNVLFRAYVEMFQKCATQQGLWETMAAYSPLLRWLFVSGLTRFWLVELMFSWLSRIE